MSHDNKYFNSTPSTQEILTILYDAVDRASLTSSIYTPIEIHRKSIQAIVSLLEQNAFLKLRLEEERFYH
jgi:hypothetical protein